MKVNHFKMGYIVLKLVAILLLACNSSAQSDVGLTLEFPRGSGLVLVDYDNFEIRDGKLYKIYVHSTITSFDTTAKFGFIADTVSTQTLTDQQLKELRTLLTKMDTLGMKTAKDLEIYYGAPRFSVEARVDGRIIKGFVANCYCESSALLLDFMNKCYDKEPILLYRRENLPDCEP